MQAKQAILKLALVSILSVFPFSTVQSTALLVQAPVIRVNSNLVSVPVSVTNTAGEPVQNLRAEDFRIEEDGKPQTISNMGEPGEARVELALLIDVSGSLLPKFDFAKQAAVRFLQSILRPVDAVSIYTIGITPRRVVDRTMGGKAALEGLMTIKPSREQTAFFDAVTLAARSTGKSAPPDARRVIVVLSDGEDNNSESSRFGDSVQALQRADCILYSINPSGPSIRLNKVSLKGHEVLQQLASQTGGSAFLPDQLEELDAIFTRIAAEIKAQYLLGYYPPDNPMDGSFRRIAVHVPKRPELFVRARQGYYAAKP
jgi:Ca-activated chloride channel family protein